MQVTLDIPNLQADRVVNALAAMEGKPVPTTVAAKQVFIKTALMQFLINATQEHERQIAQGAIAPTNLDVS